MKKIKMTVSTGWSNGDHIDYADLPDYWDNLTTKEQEQYLCDCANEYLNECCGSYAEVVEEDE